MPSITIVAKLIAKEDSIAAVRTELLKMIVPTRQENGCIEYRLHQDNQDPATFLFYEKWADLSCLEQHLDSAHYKCYVAAVGNLIADKIVHKMTEIA